LSEIEERREIGELDGSTVEQLRTMGGLYILIKKKSGCNSTVLGAGSHQAVARHLARKSHPGIRFFDLRKSEELDPKFFQEFIPYGEYITEALNSRLK